MASAANQPAIAAKKKAVPTTLYLHGNEVVGEVEAPGLLFARKYFDMDEFFNDGKHGWLRIEPAKIVSWDFRKNPALQPK